MKKLFSCILAVLAAVSATAVAEEAPPAPCYPLPNQRQMYYLHNPNAAFIHYGMNTYTDKEWGNGFEEALLFDPPCDTINTDQWVSLLKECGFDRVILTCKHHDGFCLWPSKANKEAPHTIAQTTYQNGQGDLLEQLSQSCTKYGLDMGVYLSPWDAYEEHVGGHYNNALYNDFYDEQLIEVLSKYGRYNPELGRREIVEIWLDGATGTNSPPVYDFDRFTETMRKYQPTAFIWIDALPGFIECVSGDTCKVDGAWAMNEAGQAPYPCWNKMSLDGKNANDCKNRLEGDYFLLLEADVSVRSGWFYGDGSNLKSAEDLFNERYMKSIGRGIPLILNVPPDKNGLITEEYAAELRKYRGYIDSTFAATLIPQGSKAYSPDGSRGKSYLPEKVLDGNYDTYWCMPGDKTEGSIEIEFGKEIEFDIVEIQEYIPLGQRISGWKVEVKSGGQWLPFAVGSTVGYQYLAKGNPVSATGLKLTITSSLALPLINNIAVYKTCAGLSAQTIGKEGDDNLIVMQKEYIAASETDTAVNVTVELHNPVSDKVTVNIATLPGTGVQGKVYQDKSGVLTFEKGETQKSFSVEIIDNTNNEGAKDFYVVISSPSEGAVIGARNMTRVWVDDDENPAPGYEITLTTSGKSGGKAIFLVPEADKGAKKIKTNVPAQVEAIPSDGYDFCGWTDAKSGEKLSDTPRYIYEGFKDITLKAHFKKK